MTVETFEGHLLRLSADDETVVYVDRTNAAHVLTDDGALACGLTKYTLPLWFFDPAPMVLPWWATRDKRFKPWPAWPCQSCMVIADQGSREIPNYPQGGGS